jgi:ClpP class serine protease
MEDALYDLREVYTLALQRSERVTAEDIQLIMAENAHLGANFHMASGVGMHKGQPVEGRRYTRLNEGIATIDLIGPIYPRANMMTMSGATSIETFVQDFLWAYESAQVSDVVIYVDSPGGDIRGVSEAALIIRDRVKQGKKRIVSYGAGYMASAAYFIASAAGEVWVEAQSLPGSIGTVMGPFRKGDGTIEIVSRNAPKKRPNVETPEGREAYQALVDDLGDLFERSVAAFRGVTQEHVIKHFGQGGLVVGEKAPAAKMADRVGTYEGLVRFLQRSGKGAGSSAGRTRQETEGGQQPAPLDQPSEDDMSKLSELVQKFRASSVTVDGTEPGAKSAAAESGKPDAAAAAAKKPDEGQDKPDAAADTGTKAADAAPPAKDKAQLPTREELEDRFSAAGELFAMQMVTGSRIWPAMQEHAATDLINAMVDDAMVGGQVNYVNAEGQVVQGTREASVRAKYAAFPKHTLAEKSVKALGEGEADASVLKEGKEETVTTQEVTRERIDELLAMTPAGRAALDARAEGRKA